MIVPNFVHGKMENVQKAIDTKKIVYPSYIWITDLQQYGFLNKNNELEIIGIPTYVGTLDTPIILTEFSDGLYKVKGEHKITTNSSTTFSSSSYIIVVVQTINGVKKIRRITADEIITYSIDGDDITIDAVVTESYLAEHGYATQNYVTDQINAMKIEIESDVAGYVERIIGNEIEPIVERKIDEMIQPEDDEKIEELFE